MNFRVWYSTESLADFVISNTCLSSNRHSSGLEKRRMFESDANRPGDFHTIPDHIKQILYLDAPDLIVEYDSEPIFSLELSTEAGTGHNVFQRFARLAASVENNVPAFYIYPEAVIIHRRSNSDSIKWDVINPLIFHALHEVMDIYRIPALFYYFPSDYRSYKDRPNSSPNIDNKGLKIEHGGCPLASDEEMQNMFGAMNEIISTVTSHGVIPGRMKLLRKPIIRRRRRYMQNEFRRLDGSLNSSPLSATEEISTDILLNYLGQYENRSYNIGELLKSREKTIIYKINAKFRGDPYPGALAAIDYLLCREGKTFEERSFNLVLAWGRLTVDSATTSMILEDKNNSTITDFVSGVKRSEHRNLLGKDYSDLAVNEIPRYYMQVRYGSMFSKIKHIRVYAYFADAILFPDGALWRDA